MRAVRTADLVALAASFAIALIVSFVVSLLAGCSFPRPPNVGGDGGGLPGPEIDGGGGGGDPGVVDAMEPDGEPDAGPDAPVDSPLDCGCVSDASDARVDATVDARVDATVDAEVDARPPASISVEFPIRVATGQRVGATVSIVSGRANATWSITCPAGGGTFSPASGTLPVPDGGTSIPVQYTAPGEQKDVGCSATLSGNDSATATFTARVRVPQVLGGLNNPDPNTPPTTANMLYGHPFEVVVQPGTIAVGLGAYVFAPGPNQGRLALFRDVGGRPRDRVAEGVAQSMVDGANRWFFEATTLSGGQYWIMGNFESDARVHRGGQRVPYARVAQQFGDAIPAQLANVRDDDDGPRFGYFLLVVP